VAEVFMKRRGDDDNDDNGGGVSLSLLGLTGRWRVREGRR
jgi:hypothetical protein